MKALEEEKMFGLIVVLVLWIFIPHAAFGQAEKLGPVQYTPPKGWTKSGKENVVVFSEVDHAKGNFCFMTLYGVTASTGNAQTDFDREWNNLVVKPFGAETNPKSETVPDNGWTGIAGGAAIDFEGSKAFAFLTVISGFGKTVSVLGILNDESYLPKLQAFVEGMDVDKTVAVIPPAQTVAPPQTVNGKLVIPPITRSLTLADIAGEWGQNDGINTRYVYRDSGTYAGFDSLHFTDKMTITASGEYYSDFFAIQNSTKIKEKSSGTVSVSDRVIYIKQGNLKKYVIRGWLELPDITIMEVCGPWYNDDVIPPAIFTDPNQGANLDKKWVRKK